MSDGLELPLMGGKKLQLKTDNGLGEVCTYFCQIHHWAMQGEIKKKKRISRKKPACLFIETKPGHYMEQGAEDW